MKGKIKFFVLALLVAGLFSCTRMQQQKPAYQPANNSLLMATLYNYYAAEYQALCYQAYNVGKERLTQLRNRYPHKKNMAVVVDIDETVLNNSPYQALTIEKNSHYPQCWDSWCKQAAARPVPGAVAFLRYADSLGFQVFYVTNRSDKLKAPTMKNLKAAGFPQVKVSHLYMKTNTGDKEPRRQEIEKNYDIVLLAGDNLGDFYEASAKYPERNRKVENIQKEFGEKYLVLPNAMYGTWPAALKLYGKNAPVDSLLKVMTRSFGQACR
jgi:5'-nucleotidase (lipoprotein e(P4) family)